MLPHVGIEVGARPSARSVPMTVSCSVEVQAPPFHPLVRVPLTDGRSHDSVTPQPFRNRRILRHRLRVTLWRVPCSCGTWACCACARCLLPCSSGGHCGHAKPEERNLAPRLSLATRWRCQAPERLQRSCNWCACSLPCP